jgi:hypothetical protein
LWTSPLLQRSSGFCIFAQELHESASLIVTFIELAML